MTKNSIKKGVIATGLVAAIGIAGMGAYFTSTDSASDTYTIGSIEIKNNFEGVGTELLTPLQEIDLTKATISNVGLNDAFVFMSVDIPMAEVYLHDADGVGEDAPELRELFQMNRVDGVGAAFYEVEKKPVYDDEGKQIAMRHVMAYGTASEMTPLAPEATTSAAFGILKFINVADTDADGASVPVANNIEGKEDLGLAVVAYGIQTKNLKDDVAFTGDNEDGTVAPDEVWAVVRNAMQISNGEAAEVTP